MIKSPVTIIIPTFNEEKNIKACLESVLFADDIIIVDGSSRDRTREIASSFPVTIIDTENDFAEGQRLKALPRAKHPWVFFIDADERVTNELRASIERVISSTDAASAYTVSRRNIYKGRRIHLLDPDHQLRLFRKDKTSFPDKIHRKPQVDGRIGRLEGDLLHFFFTNVQDYLRRLSEYTRAEASYRNGASAWSGLLFKPAARFLECYFLKKGFLDGSFGFFYSLSSAYYECVTAARLLFDAEPRK